jgi:integrase/recombinase XerD
VYASNGKLKPLYAVVGGREERHREGVYYLRYANSQRRVWEPIGQDPQLALTVKLKKQRILEAQSAGVETVADACPEKDVTSLSDAIQNYVAEVKSQKAHKIYLAYALTLKLFAQSCQKERLEKLDRKDVITFMESLKQQGCVPRTVANRISFLKTFFLNQGLKWPLLKSDRPRYTEKTVSAYSNEEIQNLLTAANQEEYDRFQLLLCTGAREQEAQYATWADIDFNRRTFTVREKLDLGFIPKDKEEGSIPIPDTLVEILRARKERYPGTRLIFPGPKGKPDGHLLRILKRVAFQAGLNCGQCYNRAGKCCADHATCSRWELHRFRKTFATMHHQAGGVPVRQLQLWLRHSSLSTTIRYLAGSEDGSERTRRQVNATFAELTEPRSTAA